MGKVDEREEGENVRTEISTLGLPTCSPKRDP